MQKCTTIEEILEMLAQGFTYEDIRARCGIGSSVITDIKKKYEKMGISLSELKLMSPEEIKQKFYLSACRRGNRPLPDFKDVYLKITGSQHATLFEQWIEYKEKYSNGYEYTQFKKYFADWRKEHHIDDNIKMALNRSPGNNLYIDWIGDTLPIVRNPDDPDKPLTAHFFVTTIDISDYTFCEAFPNEKTNNYVEGLADAFTFYGALPRILRPDNPKTIVIKNNKDSLVLNAMLRDFERYYGVVIVPAPPRKPKGKSLVEHAVKWLEQNLLPRLKGRLLNSFDELNEVIGLEMEKLNQRPYKSAKGNRKDMFIEFDKPAMRPLTMSPFTCFDYKYVKVPNNYHILIDNHYYSVPYKYYNRMVLVRTSKNQIIITDENNNLICTHDRAFKPFPKYITEKEHMPASHQYYYDENNYNAETYINWAGSFGPQTKEYIKRIIASFEFEEQSYKSCNGILHLIKGKPKALAEEAAKRCLASNVIGYSYFKKIYNNLTSSSDNESNHNNALPKHKNIRGKDSFK